MKRFFLFAAAFVFAVNAMAQQPTQDTTRLIFKSATISGETMYTDEDGRVTIFRFDTLLNTGAEGVASDMKDVPPMSKESSEKKPAEFTVKVGMRFMGAWNNFSEQQFGGLAGTTGAYDARTSFSSWQIELVARHKPFAWLGFGFGVGYESDVYKFNNPIVNKTATDFVVGSITSGGTPYTGGKYSSRLVTRYLNIPIDIMFYTSKSTAIGFSVIPGFATAGKNTGLKHKHDGNTYEVMSCKEIINPYKLDVRLSLKFGAVVLFVQAPTMSITKDSFNQPLYPMKAGFSIGF